MTNGCAGASLLQAHASAVVCALARAHARLAMCLYVFACLSHDVLWQPELTVQAPVEGGGRGGWRRAWEAAEQRRRIYGAEEGGTLCDCCHMMGI